MIGGGLGGVLNGVLVLPLGAWNIQYLTIGLFAAVAVILAASARRLDRLNSDSAPPARARTQGTGSLRDHRARMNRPGQVAGVLPVKRPRQAAPTVMFGIVFSSWWLFLSAGAVLPTLPAFISRHLGDGSIGIGWAYFLYSAASI